MKLTKTIGIDIDGVMYPYYECFRDYLDKQDIFLLPKKPSSYKIWEGWCSREEYIKHHYQFMEFGHYSFSEYSKKIYSGVKNTITKLRKMGFKIIIITSRGSIYEDDIVGRTKQNFEHEWASDWLFYNRIQYDDLIFTGDKSLYKFSIFVDDCTDHLNANNSLIKVCRNQSYNQDYETRIDLDRFRINKFSEIINVANFITAHVAKW